MLHSEKPYDDTFSFTSENHSNSAMSKMYSFWILIWYLYEIQNYTHQGLLFAAN